MSTLLPTQAPMAALRTLAEAHDLIPQHRVVDLLLDEYGTNADPAVRHEITTALVRFARRSLLTAAEVRDCAALVHGADQVEAAFAHLLLAS